MQSCCVDIRITNIYVKRRKEIFDKNTFVSSEIYQKALDLHRSVGIFFGTMFCVFTRGQKPRYHYLSEPMKYKTNI